ncbi:isocitrate lyase/PEP mutase family protein [Natranaerobius thermophilus]|uniref:2-methylisocitrate lyase n=1 Tax=Natranaerobius thermophilus (strain ATCC BAA-1301 / DSM 18059 / JW/NM-WN-LF) TaxID=457570 RepID=B2A7L1_NATTJ|nr:isocitrate lyase/PEP mutase family protein [Natranaerobius thermophilus]ACB85720.1 carboxyvinyl-carboxyphosphonate phosphorylmutase [Natranaerobius thermophilus JW/NM-WN-LF]
MNNTTKLKELINKNEILMAPGAHDALTARVIEQAGFNAVYMTGYGQAASVLGKPDVGLLTMTEMLDRANKIVNAVNVPVIADADTGFGNAINVIRTVEEYEKAGVAAIQLEDQVMPKKCGHMVGRQIVSQDEMVGKIEAAISARKNKDFQIIARTDARTTYGLEEALKRADAYVKAGADIIFLESPESMDEMQTINEKVEAPTLANMVEGGRTPTLKADKLEELGFNLVIYPTASTYVTAKAMSELMSTLKTEGSTESFESEMLLFEQFNELIGLKEIKDLEGKFVRGQ